MSCSKFVSSLSLCPGNGGPRTDLSVVSLKEFITYYSHELSDYYDEDFGTHDFSEPEQVGDTLIMCLVDFGYWRNTSPTTTRTLRKAGKSRRMKIKHRYSYDNPMNRIHGFLIGEEVRNSLVPEENKILSLSLICASVFSDKKGIGSDLMDHFLHLSKEAGFTDVILEVANEFSAMDVDSDDEDDESEEESDDESEDESESEDEDDESWVASEEVVEIISHEFWRKTMRKPDGETPFYNVAKDYISGHVADYLHAAEGEVEEVEPQYVSDEDDPKGHEYGGFWYRKGRNSQIGLIKFYEKFGFVEEPEINLGWHCYTDVPFPSMICSL